jgi:D-3-phosphoglycerate dehydrogenase
LPEKKFKVLRPDKRGRELPLKEELEELAKVDAEVVQGEAETEDEIIETAKDADVIITLGARMTRRVMENLPKLQAVVRYGVGYDTIDVDAATDSNVIVVNIPDFCWEEVSNHAIALLLACAKKMVMINNTMKQDGWAAARKIMAPMGSIHGQTLGIVGCGNIGRMTATKARCFSLKLLGYDPFADKSKTEECGISLVSMPELLKESDYVSVHTLLNKETYHLIGEKEFRQMKPSAYFINTSRGAVVDEPALIKALQEKWIAGVGLDVFEKEPTDPDNPLLKMGNVIVLPHTASYSEVAFQRLRRSVGQEAARIARGLWPKNVVNKGVKPKVALKEA